ncbi:MAG: sulfatase-like hydrolase/transferase, partial [Proteobacteria bacterium]|nr:sulfatase-like hydrolase/transferase [Pseudomonadota bacterium]
AYEGRQATWAHRLTSAGKRAVSIGKLHYRDDTVLGGFDETIIPMHIIDGLGDLLGAVRDPLPVRHKTKSLSEELGPGESSYTRYDRAITKAAIQWLGETAPKLEQPWTLYVGLVAPHFPLIAPEEFFAMYPPEKMPLPKAHKPEDWPKHPWFEAIRKCFIWNDFFDDDKRRLATASYFALCSFLDDNIGKILAALEGAGFGGNTRIVYSSDHGDNLGVRGLWGKSNHYQESVAIPMIMAGPDVPQGKVVSTPVTLVDVFPTVLECTGTPRADEDLAKPGRNLLTIAQAPDDEKRVAFSEYHAAGAASGAFMIRRGRFKLVHFVGMTPQLFDLKADPEEMNDLAGKAEYAATVAELNAELRKICDPDEVDARAKADQAAVVEKNGGRDAVIKRGTFGATPPPGSAAKFV